MRSSKVDHVDTTGQRTPWLVHRDEPAMRGGDWRGGGQTFRSRRSMAARQPFSGHGSAARNRSSNAPIYRLSLFRGGRGGAGRSEMVGSGPTPSLF
jgi:hypothetical protein